MNYFKNKFPIVAVLITIFLTMALLIGCANLKEQWGNLSPGEKARIVLGDMQDQLTTAFDTGKAFVDANPDYKDQWQKKIIPAFDTANKAIAASIVLAKEGKTDINEVISTVQPLLDSVVTLLKAMGVVVPKTASLQFRDKAEPMQAGMDYAALIPLLIAGINGLIGLAFNLYKTLQQIAGKEAIPTWGEITDENKLLQSKIDAEKEKPAEEPTGAPDQG